MIRGGVRLAVVAVAEKCGWLTPVDKGIIAAYQSHLGSIAEERHFGEIPAHACEPPVPRNDPHFQKVIKVSAHGYPEELQLRGEIERLIASSGEDVRLQPVAIRDADLYIIVTIGVGVEASLVAGLIEYLSRRLREGHDLGRKPAVYISPAYSPKRVFLLPREEVEAQSHFRRHPSRSASEVRKKDGSASPYSATISSSRRHSTRRRRARRSSSQESIARERWSRSIVTPVLSMLTRMIQSLFKMTDGR